MHLLPGAAACDDSMCPSRCVKYPLVFRDWSLIMGRGGATKRERGGGGAHVKFYPYEKGGRKKFWPF